MAGRLFISSIRPTKNSKLCITQKILLSITTDNCRKQRRRRWTCICRPCTTVMECLKAFALTRQSMGLAVALFAGVILAFSASNALAYRVFVSNEKENTVSVIDSETLEVIHTIKTGNRPRGIILGNEGKWVIVCVSDDNKL